MPDTGGHSQLALWQQAMAGYLLSPLPDTSGMHSWLTPAVQNAEALKIYRNNVLFSLTEALAAQYPVVKRLVGDAFSQALARNFVFNYPPVNAALTFYGEQMPAFIASHEHCRSLVYLSDVARLEFLCQQSLHAADRQTLDPVLLSTLDTDTLLHLPLPTLPCVKLMESAWPVHRIRAANRAGSDEEIQISNDGKSALLIHRENDSVKVRTLAFPVFCFLQALQQGLLLIDAWRVVQEEFGLPDQELTTLLTMGLRLQIFAHTALSHGGDPSAVATTPPLISL